MGGDRAPAEIVKGAILAQSTGCSIILVGQPDAIEAELSACGATPSPRLSIVRADDVVAMDESPAAVVRSRRQTSMSVALELVKQGEADAAVSAGNSGAMMGLAMRTLGRIKGIERPAIATLFPITAGGETVLLDAGANVDCSPENLLQFALMGNEFARGVLNVRQPRVAILSIGEESSKGNAVTKEAAMLLGKADLRFIGNIEGGRLFSGDADVIVCDGFVGNVALKVAEGTAEFVQAILAREFRASPMRMTLGRLCKPVFQALRLRTDYDQRGGAPLLGVNGVAIISHGRSNAKAILNAVREADEAVKHNVVCRISAAVGG